MEFRNQQLEETNHQRQMAPMSATNWQPSLRWP